MSQPIVKTIPRPLVTANQIVIISFVILTWFTNIEWFLAVPLIAGLSGLIFKFNPIMQIAKLFLQKEPSKYAQEEFEQQQFNQFIAVICLGIGLLAFALKWSIVGYVFTAMVAIAAFVALCGFCIGCFIRYQWQQRIRKFNK